MLLIYPGSGLKCLPLPPKQKNTSLWAIVDHFAKTSRLHLALAPKVYMRPRSSLLQNGWNNFEFYICENEKIPFYIKSELHN